jgi:hypothetical protein
VSVTDELPEAWQKKARQAENAAKKPPPRRDDLLEDLRRYVAGSLPTHVARGGEVDRQRLLKSIDEALNAD